MKDEIKKATRHQAVPEDLQTSEIRYRRLFESARDGILILDAAGRRITDVNPFMVEFLGYSRNEFLGKELWEIGLFKDKAESQAAFRELQERGYIRYEDLPLRTKAGKQWNVEFISNVYLENGHHVIQCNIRDITERKSIEERLKQSEQWLRTIFEASHEGILVEENERIHYVNKAYLHMFGYDVPEELVGRHISVVVAPEDVGRLLEFGSGRLRGEQPPSEYEFKGRRKDGSTVDVEASVSVSHIAGSKYITTMIRDITERKQAEEALRESEMRFRAMFEQANVGIVQASFDGTLLKVNPGFCKIVGYSEVEATGMAIRDLTYPDDYKKEKALTLQLMAGEILGYSIEKRYRRKEGPLIWGLMTATRVSHSSGEPFYLLAIVEDISERKRAEEALVELNEQLEQRVAKRTAELVGLNASLQEEIAVRQRAERERALILRRLAMAHEEERRRIARDMHDQFGQQLTVLRMKLDALYREGVENENLCEQVETLQAIARQLDADVDHMVWEMRPTALDDLGLESALSSYVQKWSQHIAVPVQLHASGMDKDRLQPEIETTLYRIAQEALNNIAKHAEAKNVGVVLECRANQVSLIIDDDGVGFDLQGVLDADAKGLGLIGMRERAALVGGTVEIESQPDTGATIFVRIPTPRSPGRGESDG